MAIAAGTSDALFLCGATWKVFATLQIGRDFRFFEASTKTRDFLTLVRENTHTDDNKTAMDRAR